MACKYYESHMLGSDYCNAKGTFKSEKVTYDHAKKYCQNNSGYEKCNTYKEVSHSSGPCFITSACVVALGCQDDGSELTTMRNFRDNWLKLQSNGPAEIEKYYVIAPQIVKAIDSETDSLKIYKRIYNEFIQPCVSFASQGDNESAYRRYSSMIETLSTQYLMV